MDCIHCNNCENGTKLNNELCIECLETELFETTDNYEKLKYKLKDLQNKYRTVEDENKELSKQLKEYENINNKSELIKEIENLRDVARELNTKSENLKVINDNLIKKIECIRFILK